MNVVHEQPATGKRATRREATVARFVDAALQVLTEEGIEALTMQRLADQLGYAIGAVYRYFPGKDALVLAVQRRVLELLADDLAAADARALAHLGRSPTVTAKAAALTRLLVAARTYEGLITRRPAHFGLLSRWLGDPAPLVATESAIAMLPGLIQLFAPMPALFDAARDAGALGDGDGLRRTIVLWGALHGTMQLHKLGRFGLPALRSEELGAETCRAVLLGWGASEADLMDAVRRAQRLTQEGEGS